MFVEEAQFSGGSYTTRHLKYCLRSGSASHSYHFEDLSLLGDLTICFETVVCHSTLMSIFFPINMCAIKFFICLMRNQDSAVVIVTGCGQDSLRFRVMVPLGKRISSLRIIETGSGINSDSCAIGTGSPFLGGKTASA